MYVREIEKKDSAWEKEREKKRKEILNARVRKRVREKEENQCDRYKKRKRVSERE